MQKIRWAALAIAALMDARAADTWHTWAITDVLPYRTVAPPDRSTSEREARELEALATQRDAAALESVRYWNAGSPAYRWLQIAQLEVNGHGLSGPPATRALSLVAVALNDAIV